MAEHTLEAELTYCEVHPTRETSLRCNKCNRLMCTHCAVRTPVGYRCRECISNQQAVFYSATSLDYVIAALVAGILGGLGAFLVGLVGFFWYIAIIGSPVVGAIIADMAHRAVGRRRGKYTWLVVAGSIVVGALLVKLIPFVLVLLYWSTVDPEFLAGQTAFTIAVASVGRGGLGWLIYLVMAPGAAVSQLRFSRRRR